MLLSKLQFRIANKKLFFIGILGAFTSVISALFGFIIIPDIIYNKIWNVSNALNIKLRSRYSFLNISD